MSRYSKLEAAQRAREAVGRLGVFPGRLDQRARVAKRVELLLYRFLSLRWYDAHRFFGSVESAEVKELVHGVGYTKNGVFQFFAERQDDAELENTMVVGLSLVFAAMRRAAERGMNPKTTHIFTLQRMDDGAGARGRGRLAGPAGERPSAHLIGRHAFSRRIV